MTPYIPSHSERYKLEKINILHNVNASSWTHCSGLLSLLPSVPQLPELLAVHPALFPLVFCSSSLTHYSSSLFGPPLCCATTLVLCFSILIAPLGSVHCTPCLGTVTSAVANPGLPSLFLAPFLYSPSGWT